MMAELLYKIADIINANSKVYRAVVPEARHDYMMYENGKLVKCSSHHVIWQSEVPYIQNGLEHI